jgi:hypothetical protein
MTAAEPFSGIEEMAPCDKGFGRQQSSDSSREKDFRGTGSKKRLSSVAALAKMSTMLFKKEI